nr:hypothetical protein [Pseudonocardia sp. EC080625-04]
MRDEQDTRPGVPEDVRDVGDAVAGVDADHVRPERGGRELRDDGVGPVRQPHPDAVTGADAVVAQVVAQRDGPAQELVAGHRPRLRAAVDHDDRSGCRGDGAGQQVGQGLPGAHAVTSAGRTACSRSQPSRIPATSSSSSIG